MSSPRNRASLTLATCVGLSLFGALRPSPALRAEDPAAPVDEELRKEVDAFLVGLREAYRSGSSELYLEHVDMERMTREVAQVCELNPLQVITLGLRKILDSALSQRFELVRDVLRWEEHRVIAIERLGETDLRISARLIDAEGISRRFAWWISRAGDRRRLYDLEDLGTVWRLSIALRAVLYRGTTNPTLVPALMRLQAAVKMITEENYRGAEVTLDEIAIELPPGLEAQRSVLAATTAIALGDYEQTLAHCARVDKSCHEAPIVHYLRASALVQLERAEESLVSLEAFERALGRDADTCDVRGRALRKLGRSDEAKTAFREGLRDTSASSSCLAGLATLLDEKGHDELVSALGAPKDPAVLFESTCGWLLLGVELPALERLIAAYREIDAESTDIDFYTAGIHVAREEHEQAAALYLRGSTRAAAAERELFLERYLDQMITLEKAVDGYERVTDADFAFGYLTDWYSDDPSMLESLIAAHRRRVPADPFLDAWQAEVHFLRGEYEDVVRSLRGKLDPDGQIDIYWLEGRLFRSFLRTKRTEEALTLARASTARDKDPFYEVFAHALRGEVAETIAAAARCIEDHGYTAQDFYDDEDAGEVLRTGEAFAPMRERWPLDAPPPAGAPERDAPEGETSESHAPEGEAPEGEAPPPEQDRRGS